MMDLIGIITGSIAIISLFVGLPITILSFINKFKENKNKAEIEKMKYQKEILELEIEKENITLKRLEAENKKYDEILKISE
jgi:predicted thioesterase